MPTINQLSAVDAVVASDQVPIYSSQNGDARKASMENIKEFIEEDFQFGGGILALSSIYALRKTAQATVAVGTSYANIANYDGSLITPSGRDSLSLSTVLGEMVAARDIEHVQFWVTLTGTWPANRDLTLAVLIGTDAAPYESSFKYVGAGRGANIVTASFSGPAANLNNGGNMISEGEKIRLVAKFNTSDNLDIQRLVFAVQTLDGI